MPAVVPAATERVPRRARYLLPESTPRRTEILAALSVAALLAAVLFAPLTLVLAAACHLTGRLTRWRPVWLAAPAACGLVWLLAAGPRALAGFGAVPAAVAAVLAAVAADPLHIARLAGVPAIIARGIGGGFPVALLLAPAVAAAAAWLDWLHTSEWDRPAARPGLVSVCRRRYWAAFIGSGGVLTRDGACLGVHPGTGQPVTLSWREARGGLLVTGADQAAAARAGFQLAHAAIRRRQPVIVVDLAGDDGLAAALAGACAAAGAELHVFGARGGRWYEPFAGTGPAGAAALITAMIDWSGAAESSPRECLAYLTRALAAAAAASPGAAVLDTAAALLRPPTGAGQAPGPPAAAGWAHALARWPHGNPAAAALAARQLTMLAASETGQWLRPAPGNSPPVSIGQVVRRRSVALFPLSRSHGQAAAMLANLVAADTAAVYSHRHRAGAGGDGLAWFSGCDPASPAVLARLVHEAGPAGLATVLAPASPRGAATLLGHAGSCLSYRLADLELAGRIAAASGTQLAPAAEHGPAAGVAAHPGPGDARQALAGGTVGGRAGAMLGMARFPLVAAGTLGTLADREFVLITGLAGRPGARQPAVTRGAAVQARVPGRARARPSPRRLRWAR
jgi:hypothetical protein